MKPRRGTAVLDAVLRLWTPITLEVVAIVFVVQSIRGPLGRAVPELQFWLGIAPNFATALLLPFAWDREGRPLVFSAHARRCLVVAAGVCGYELAQGAGLVPAHPRFDVNDAMASIVGAALALGAGWVWTWRPTRVGSARGEILHDE